MRNLKNEDKIMKIKAAKDIELGTQVEGKIRTHICQRTTEINQDRMRLIGMKIKGN